jgi:hypothetical protein
MGQTTSDAINMTNTVTYTSVDQPAVCVDDAETFAPSTAQWVNNKLGHWRFEWRDADDTFGDMTYQYVSATGSYLYTSDWSAHPYQYADLMGEKLSPAQNRDTVKTYTAPHDGRVQMDVRVARYNEYAAGGSATPTTLRIYKNNEQIWPTNGDAQQITSTSEVTYQVSADVRAGDRLRCVVGSMGDTTGDEIRMYNTVTYRAVGTRELAAVADQYNQRIDVINLWGDNLDSAETALQVLAKVKTITFAESLGGPESLITLPATQTHADVPAEDRERLGITDAFLRMSVGLENAQDLIADLQQAMA